MNLKVKENSRARDKRRKKKKKLNNVAEEHKKA